MPRVNPVGQVASARRPLHGVAVGVSGLQTTGGRQEVASATTWCCVQASCGFVLVQNTYDGISRSQLMNWLS